MFSISEPQKYRISTDASNRFTVYFPTNVQSNTAGFYYDEALTLIVANSLNAAETILNDNLETYKSLALENFSNFCKSTNIKMLKNQLTATDYKLLKSVENYMLGVSSDYNVADLIYNRTGLRNAINMLQNPVSEQDELVLEQNRKILELQYVCQTTITSGINVGENHYSLNTFDQINISTLGLQAQGGTSVPYHADGELCRLYTPQEFLPIVQSATAHIMYHTTYFNCLKMQVRNMTNISEICNINYGDTLLPEYATVLNQIVGG